MDGTSFSSGTQRLVLEAIIKDVDPKYLMDYLYQEGAISEDEMQELENKVTRKERCRVLISQLNQRPNSRQNFELLVKALETQGYAFLKNAVKTILHADSSALSQYTGTKMTDTLKPQDDLAWLYVLPPAGGGMQACKQARLLFDRLSSLLNSGRIDLFNSTCVSMLQRNALNADTKCVVKYLQACRYSFSGNFCAGLSAITEGKVISRRSSSPVQYMVYLLSCQCWIYIKSANFHKLNACLNDAEQNIQTNKVLCQGMASGWIFIDRAKYILPLVDSRSPHKAAGIIKRACGLFDQALEQFQLEKSRDGPYGFTYALILKATVLLRCGSLMNTVQLPVTEGEVSEASRLLVMADSSEIGLPCVLRPSYYIAMADLNFRRQTFIRAEEYAQQALDASESLNLPEFLKQSKARLNCLHIFTERIFEKQSIVNSSQRSCWFIKTSAKLIAWKGQTARNLGSMVSFMKLIKLFLTFWFLSLIFGFLSPPSS